MEYVKNLTSKISTTLKALRHQRGWSLDATSQRTGVSKAMLGQIEREESCPTIATLWKIASGFNVSFSSFVDDLEHNQSGFIHRKQVLHPMHKQDDKIKIMPIFPFDEHLQFEIFIIKLLPGCSHLSLPHQKGVVEHVIVVNGTMEVFIDHSWHKVDKNEGLRFAADQPHGYRNLSDTPSLFHDIIHYPEFHNGTNISNR